MHAAADRPEFEPPPQPGAVRAFVLAILAHGLLLLALTHGLQWQREAQNAVVEAELWSALPQQAAPPPAPEPPPPAPAPVVRAPPPPPPPEQREADIALQREKELREAELRQAELRRQAELAERELEERRRLEAQKRRAEELARQKRAEELAQKKREEELAKKKRAEELAQKQREEEIARRKRDEEIARKRKEQEAQEAKRVEALRQENLRRMQEMVGDGGAGSAGSAARSSGPSAGWGARVQARVRPNIVFTETLSGNPQAIVEVRTSPDGTIMSRRLIRSSGSKPWDEAVLRALDKTRSLPPDVDGRVPSPVEISFTPRG